jgi:hypothetical protein
MAPLSRQIIKLREISKGITTTHPHPPTQTPRILEPLEYNFGILEKDKKGTIKQGWKKHTKTPNNSLPTTPWHQHRHSIHIRITKKENTSESPRRLNEIGEREEYNKNKSIRSGNQNDKTRKQTTNTSDGRSIVISLSTTTPPRKSKFIPPLGKHNFS